MDRSANKIKEMVEEEIKGGIPVERILIGGISQGGYTALHAAFTYDKFGGVE